MLEDATTAGPTILIVGAVVFGSSTALEWVKLSHQHVVILDCHAAVPVPDGSSVDIVQDAQAPHRAYTERSKDIIRATEQG